MKRSLMIGAVMAVLAFVSTPSFALIDGEVYGGYNFAGKFSAPAMAGVTSKDVKVSGFDYGARAHLTGGLLIVDYGLGGYFQRKPLEYSLSSKTYELMNINYGFDGFIRLNLPVIPIKPYARAGLSIADYNEAKQGNTTAKLDTKYFNSYYTGFGVGLSLPIPVVLLMVYGEYLYNHQIYSGKLTGNTFNVGISLGI